MKNAANTILSILVVVSMSSCYKKLYLNSQTQLVQAENHHQQILDQKAFIDSLTNPLHFTNDSLLASKTSLQSNINRLVDENAILANSTQTDIIQVVTGYLRYFDTVALINQNAQPPCRNSANGFFRDRIAVPYISNVVAAPDIHVTTKEGGKFYNAMANFVAVNQTAFNQNGNHQESFRDRVDITAKKYGKPL